MISVKPVWGRDSGDDFSRAIEDGRELASRSYDEWYALFDVLAANRFMSAIPGDAGPAYRRFVEMFRPTTNR